MSNAVELRPAMSPQRIGQATAVEQSRAIAEVHAMIVVAQQMPRSIDRAVREMQRSCSYKAVAEKAFYRYKRGSGQVTGESITLAKELARCWGNIDYGLAELRRDDYAGESEMMAFAWDLETNTRPRTTFIVPHVRDNGSRLTAPRDIYENNANMGVRRMREQILNLMPPWFIEDAKALCYATMAADDSDGGTLAERAATAVRRYTGIGVTAGQLAQKLGAPQAAWSAADLAQLGVIYKSVERGETTKEDEFGATAATITAADLAPKNASPAGTPEAATPSPSAPSVRPPADVPPAGEAQPALATTGQVGIVNGLLEGLGLPGDENRDARVRVVGRLVGRPLASTKQMTRDEAHKLREDLKGCTTPEDLDLLIAEREMASDPRDEGEVPGA